MFMGGCCCGNGCAVDMGNIVLLRIRQLQKRAAATDGLKPKRKPNWPV